LLKNSKELLAVDGERGADRVNFQEWELKIEARKWETFEAGPAVP
jgi:hypothetical protein